MAEIKARFNDFYPYCNDKVGQIVFDLERPLSREELQNLYDLKDNLLDLKWKKHRNKRSLNANAYHWALCSELAAVLESTPQAIHKELLLQGPTLKITDGVAAYVIYPESYDPPDTEYIKAFRDIYFKNKKGKSIRHIIYLIYKDSHEMNSAEFARLIEDTITACHKQGIETKTKEEVDQMVREWNDRKAAGHEE